MRLHESKPHKKQVEYIADVSQWEFDGACLCNNCLEELKVISDL